MRNISKINLKGKPSLIVISQNCNYNVYVNGHIYVVNNLTGDIIQFDDDSFELSEEHVTKCIETIREDYPDF